jgi:hypothetical protein
MTDRWPFRERPAARVVLPLLALLTACEQPAATWVDANPVATTMPSPMAHPPFVPYDSTLLAETPAAQFLETQDVLREVGALSLLVDTLAAMPAVKDSVPGASLPAMRMAPAPTTSLGEGDAPLDSARCARSLRVVVAPGRGRVAVWWTRAGQSRVHLVAAWRDSLPEAGRLGAWRGPIVVDSVDQGPRDAQADTRGGYGCARPAASVAVDSVNGYVHVAYALTGPEGPGVFYAHQMDPRAAFEPPVAVLYGERLGVARVASHGDVVAVAYEDPNSRGRVRIGVAVSRTAGHLFEERLTASGGTEARDPHVVVRGRAVVVGWSDYATPTAEPSFRLRRAVVH